MAGNFPLRVGIVGGNAERGWARDAHIPALRALPDFRIVAVSARNQELAQAAAAAFNAPRAFGDSLQLVRAPDIDVVAVTVKVPEHRAIVLAALEAGKHVYCEWPLGRDTAEAEEMARAARNAGVAANSGAVHAAIGVQALSAPAVRHAMNIVQAGLLGELRVLRVVSPTAGWGPVTTPFFTYLEDPRLGATMLAITGGHTLAVMQDIVGDFVELDARCSTLQKTVRIAGSKESIERGCADHVLVMGRHASGCVSSLEVIGGQRSAPFSLELQGSKGTLSIRSTTPALGGFQTCSLVLETSVGTDAMPAPVAPSLHGAPANIAEAYARFVADIRAGQRTLPDFDYAVRLTRLLDVIERASETGTRQKI